MFECKLDGMFLRRLFESLKEICSDVSIDCSDDGLTMQAMDNSHISLIHLKLSPDFFHLYRCDLPCTLGLNISFMLKILSVVKEKSLIYLSRGDMSEDPVLNIRIIEDVGANLTLGTFRAHSAAESDSLEAQVKLIEVDREHLEIPSCDYSCKCVMNSKKFQEFAKYLHSIGETVTISMSENEMRLETEGEGIRASKRFHSDVGEVRVTSIENLSQIFATRYLVLFSKATNLAEQVSINLSAGIPLSVKFGFSDEEDTSFINFYLAPNIEE